MTDMKNWIPLFATVLLLAFAGSGAGAEARVATINLQKVFDKYWKTKQAEALLKTRADDMEKEHKNMLQDWKKARDDYQGLQANANDQALSIEEREKRKKSVEDKLKYLRDPEDATVQYEKQC